MGINIAMWRSRIGLFTPYQVYHLRQLHIHTNSRTNQGITGSMVAIFIFTITVTLISSGYLANYSDATDLNYGQLHHVTCNAQSHHNLFTIENACTGSATPPCNLQPSLLLLCMDIHPNPGPTSYEPTQDENPQTPKLTKLFNVTKKIQMKLVRHQHHLQNYIYYRKNNIIPKGLNSKCRPTISTNNPCFYEQWQKNRLINGRINLKLLTQECRRIIKTLEEQLAIKKELLRKKSSIECFNYYNEKLSSMASSLEILLFNRRLRKNISTRPNQTNQIVHPTSSTPQRNTPHNVTTTNTPSRKRSRRKNTKKPPTYNNKPSVLYSAANDPETANDPRPEMIPKLDRK